MFSTQRIIVAPEWRETLRAAGLESVQTIYEARGDTVTRSGSTQVVRIVSSSWESLERGRALPIRDTADCSPALPASADSAATGTDHPRSSCALFVKKYWIRGWGDLRRTFFRGAFFGRSKMKREFQNLGILRAAGLDAPAPVAYGEERRMRALLRSFLITEGVIQPMTLAEYICDHLPSLPGDEQRAKRRELIESLAGYTRRMHQTRFVHHDYFWRNILLNGTALSRFWLIDTPKGRCWRFGGLRHRAKDLATLDAPAPLFFRRTERLRFLLRYLGAARLTPAGKKLARSILAVAAPIREEQYRRVGFQKREVHGATVR